MKNRDIYIKLKQEVIASGLTSTQISGLSDQQIATALKNRFGVDNNYLRENEKFIRNALVIITGEIAAEEEKTMVSSIKAKLTVQELNYLRVRLEQNHFADEEGVVPIG